ncbi:VWA domain-containing protein [Roseofilum casamattae]|uniref:VWA domain-containing protein n=1 Tax=Roseofilum casamattae BLCC-M143 TaxID=3022442 RepID=A0ABT7BXD2_9CYAN|nr:VWA domain-containing protein [Roseofilum casamattae]MDJ1183826.1 VWA domain-containing protein [Roseofilum casamattae BLCC-M143]
MITQLTKGARFNLSQNYPDIEQFQINLGWTVDAEDYDIDGSVFMLGTDGLIPAEEYFVFYNNPRSPDLALERRTPSVKNGQSFILDLAKLDAAIAELVFVVTIHDAIANQQNFGRVRDAFIAISSTTTHEEFVRYNLTEQFTSETALEFGRLYQKDGQWRFHALGQGYDSGLQGFLDRYHQKLESAEKLPEPPVPTPVPTPVPAPVPARRQKSIELEKKLERDAPMLFDLVKKADISLAKANLTDHQARVALCLDVSGSMYSLYQSGKIQRLAEKILALGCRFDDDEAIKIFLFAGDSRDMGEMTVDNFRNFIGQAHKQYKGAGGTKYGAALQAIRRAYFPDGYAGQRQSPVTASQPVYVMFVTDGQPFDKPESERQLQWSSYEPIFWQFMAIGKSNKDVRAKRGGILGFLSGSSQFEFLESLDDLSGRYIDNADFFSVEDPAAIADEELYDLLMTEYPNWLKMARDRGLLS